MAIPSPSSVTRPSAWPSLPLDGWRDSYATLHMWTQIVGKTRLALAPMQNHWWQVALYVTERGLSTSAMPSDGRSVTVEFDFIDHQLYVRTSDDRRASVPLRPQTVAEFYHAYLEAVRSVEVSLRLWPVPVEVEIAIPFAEDEVHACYDGEAARSCWQVMTQVHRVLERYRGQFQGKASPVHFFWGAFDLCTTRFSGRRAPLHPGGAPNTPDYVMQEGYSHECASCGFWPGGGLVDEPAFYAYAYPEPIGYSKSDVSPEGAYYHDGLKEFILPYEAVRNAASPDEALLKFVDSTYVVAADLGNWDRDALERAPSARH